ncbi:hypothetical protein CPB83DRAFT_843859 [Crepidotus variabilis]|uniref:Uncharacterized protein n=1 Tax=Crepidotus variabilis TaxID=179855 RepID=A0A9P6ESV4_9AGAR|nr:hypothetical protein CPB83DRAFT_843859 [Crepidotus variabilis]
MSFKTRNCYYLRISNSTVLPVYVYLDERHVHWMSDTVLQHVLSDLRPNILPKLKAEAELLIAATSSTKKPTVDTHRGETYQFCYFLRKTEPHSVVLKSRTFSAAPQQSPRPPQPPKVSQNKKGKRKAASSKPSSSQKKRVKTANPIVVGSSDEEDITMDGAQDNDYLPPGLTDENDAMTLDVEEEEAKPKPILGLKYQGFSIYGSCLCIVVEPWPVVRTMTGVAAALAKMPAKPSQSRIGSNKQPLFLPEEPEEEPARDKVSDADPKIKRYVNKSYLKQVLNEVIELSDDSDEHDDEVGMMELTQVLRNAGDIRAGAMNDDEDMDGSVLFGDADEYREL